MDWETWARKWRERREGIKRGKERTLREKRMEGDGTVLEGKPNKKGSV